MARRDDSGWRDSNLTEWHVRNGFPCPAAGTVMPMIEYDRGFAVGIVNYIPRGNGLPQGPEVGAAYRAFGKLHCDGGQPMPFVTAVYDPRNWAMQLFPHNDAARELVSGPTGLLFGQIRVTTAAQHNWRTVTELDFAALLYAMRGRKVPDMFGYGVEWNEQPWTDDDPVPARGNLPFPCADISARRRAYEPAVAAPMRVKVPCMDIDLAVTGPDENLALVVDYKRRGAVCDLTGTNAKALASLANASGMKVPAFMTRYHSDESSWWFETYPLNGSASGHLAYALGSTGAWPYPLAQAVAGDQWVRLNEQQWLDVLRVARDV